MSRLRFRRGRRRASAAPPAVGSEVQPRLEHGVFGDVVALLVEVGLAVLVADDGVAEDDAEFVIDFGDGYGTLESGQRKPRARI